MNAQRVFLNICVSLLLLLLLLFAAESVYSRKDAEILFSVQLVEKTWVLKSVLPTELEVQIREGALQDGQILHCNPTTQAIDAATPAYVLQLDCEGAKLAVGRLRFNK